MTERSISRAEWLAVLAGCAVASLVALAWSWRHGAMLNYGDAVAHLHIARRTFDAHNPGLRQLGSVWLPLPHLLMMPFVAIYSWWANGFAAVIPSALAYLVACVGIYRLARRWLGISAAAVALVFFATNPNLLYVQTTAMTEPLFICETVWAAVWLVEWRANLENDPKRSNRLLGWIAFVLVAAVYTRYDGWIMAALAWTLVGVVMARRGGLRSRTFWIASAAVVAAPVVWFAYNAAIFGDWLDFIRGPYSAKAIELRTALPGGPPHPGWHDPWMSLLFYAKAAEMDAAALAWGNFLFVISLAGTAWAWLTARRKAFVWALIVWLPLPFYAYSVAYGSVPIFLPVWWPHSFYNTRYGMELLPALALGLGFTASFLIATIREFKQEWAKYGVAALFAIAILNDARMLREQPLVFIESTKNIDSRRQFENEIPPAMRALLEKRPSGMVLMNTSVYPELVALTGIPLRQTINEGDYVLYQTALAAPAANAYLVLAFDGDEIDRAVHAHPAHLTTVGRFTCDHQAPATLYLSDAQ